MLVNFEAIASMTRPIIAVKGRHPVTGAFAFTTYTFDPPVPALTSRADSKRVTFTPR